MVSALRSPTGWMRTKCNGGPLLEFLGLSVDDARRLDDAHYCARVLGRSFTSALEAPETGRVLLSYPQLPEGLIDIVRRHFRIELTQPDCASMLAVAAYDAKSASAEAFRPDAQAKRAQAEPHVRDASARWVDPAFRALEATREASL